MNYLKAITIPVISQDNIDNWCKDIEDQYENNEPVICVLLKTNLDESNDLIKMARDYIKIHSQQYWSRGADQEKIKVKRIQFGVIGDVDNNKFEKMFKNKDKEIVFYNSKSNNYKQVFKEELNDNLEDVSEGYLDEFFVN